MYISTRPSYVGTNNLPSATTGVQNLLCVKLMPALALTHNNLRRGVNGSIGVGSRLVASYARAMPATGSWLASPSIGASAQTIPVPGLLPLEESANIPPGIPPIPCGLAASAADATSAPLPTKLSMLVAGSSFHARRDSFSPQVKTMGPAEPCQ